MQNIISIVFKKKVLFFYFYFLSKFKDDVTVFHKKEKNKPGFLINSKSRIFYFVNGYDENIEIKPVPYINIHLPVQHIK